MPAGTPPEGVISEAARALRFDYQESGVTQEDIEDLLRVPIPGELYEALSSDKLLRGYLTSVARRALREQRTNRLQHLDRYDYRPVDVKRMLKDISDPEYWEMTFVPDDAKWVKGNDSMEVLMDVLLAMGEVPMEDRVILFRTYWLNDPADDLLVREAVISLTKVMNQA